MRVTGDLLDVIVGKGVCARPVVQSVVLSALVSVADMAFVVSAHLCVPPFIGGVVFGWLGLGTTE